MDILITPYYSPINADMCQFNHMFHLYIDNNRHNQNKFL